MNSRIHTTITFVLVLAVSFFFYLHYNSVQKNEVKVVDIIKLFNAYQLKIDMEKADSTMLMGKVKEMDSIKALLEIQKSDMTEQQYFQYHQHLDHQYDEVLMASNQRINEAVWKKINEVIKDYSKSKGFKVLVGANGTGNVMYYDVSTDVTADLIMYMNKDYEKQ